MDFQTRIEHKLAEVFSPERLEVVDESHHHAGHGGWREGGQTHFRVRIVSSAFAGKTRLEIHRAVNEALSEELKERVHALAIEASAA